MLQILPATNIDFIGKRWFAFVFSACLMLSGLYAVYLISTSKANMGLDFSGGISMQLKFTKPVKTDKIREVMDKNKMPQASIQQIGAVADNEFLIRVKQLEKGATTSTEQLILETLKKDTLDEGITVSAVTTIEPVVSAQLKEKAGYAIFWALVGILVYIWLRFKFKFAVAATIATLHDVLAILGIMVLMGKEIDLLVITAVLTLAGYSLTDTVVVFDRIRENMRFILKTDFKQVINNSINEVLSRTIVTSGVTMLVVVSLFLFGGEVIHSFSLALLMGIVVGTYSSVFVASPIVYEWEQFEKKRMTKHNNNQPK